MPIADLLLAESHKAAGRLAEAVLRRVLAGAPYCHPAYHALGLIAFEVGKLPLAVELIAKAISLNAEAGLYHRNLGELCRRLGRLEEACRCFEAAIRAAPDFIEPHYNLSSLKTYHAGDLHLAMLERNIAKADAMPVKARIRFWFALGKAQARSRCCCGCHKFGTTKSRHYLKATGARRSN